MTLVAMGLVVESDLTFVVAVTDMLLSSSTYSVHMPFGSKVLPLHDPGKSGWLIGYAGNPTHFHPLRDMIARSVAPDASANSVIETARLAYNTYYQNLVEETVLSPYNITMRDFKDTGRAIFGEQHFNEICKRVDEVNPGIDLIIGGFSEPKPASSGSRLARIFNPAGELVNDYVYGVAAIGEGTQPASEFLYAVHDRFGSVYAALYRLLEAKFISEAATRSVGPETTMLVMAPDKTVSLVSNAQCEKFRSAWKRRRTRLPRKMLELLKPSGPHWL